MAVGLHYDDTDLAEWLARTDSGHPNYCVAYTTNQGWPNITARAAEFIANPSAQIYTGVTRVITDYVRQGDTPSPNANPYNYGRQTVCAAFVALVTSNSTYATAVMDFLFDQMAEPKTDFSNTTHWNVTYANENGPFWGICEWLVRLLYAFDYIKDTLSPTDKSDIEAWFYNAAEYFHADLWARQSVLFEDEADMAAGIFKIGGWGTPSNPYTYGGTQVYTHRDSAFTKYNALEVGNTQFSNRMMSLAHFVGLCGVYFDETTWKNNAKYIVKNNIRHALFPDGTNAEAYRTTTDSIIEAAFYYSANIYGYATAVADALYRVGDSELLAFLTSEGHGNAAGGLKSLKLGWQGMCRYKDETIVNGGPAYAERTTTNDEANKINGDSVTTWRAVHQCWSAWANMYYADTEIEEGYKMTNVGGYPSSPMSGNVSYMYSGATIPDALFMWGDRQYASGKNIPKRMML